MYLFYSKKQKTATKYALLLFVCMVTIWKMFDISKCDGHVFNGFKKYATCVVAAPCVLLFDHMIYVPLCVSNFFACICEKQCLETYKTRELISITIL